MSIIDRFYSWLTKEATPSYLHKWNFSIEEILEMAETYLEAIRLLHFLYGNGRDDGFKGLPLQYCECCCNYLLRTDRICPFCGTPRKG